MKLTGWQIVAMVAICVSPFWILASNWRDMSEAKSTALSAVLAGVFAGVIKVIDVVKKQ